MAKEIDFIFDGLKPRSITTVDTQLGYLKVYEYMLQDMSFLHVVQWHYCTDICQDKLLPDIHCKTFYREKDNALKLAHEIGNNLLQQFTM